jgi:hypothetical protein
MDVEMKMTRFNGSDRARFFCGFPFRSLTVGQLRISRSLRKSPLAAAIGVDQEEFDRSAPPAITDCGDLQRQGLRNAG